MSDSKDKENENEINRKNSVKNEIKNEIKDENDKKEQKNAKEEEPLIKNGNNIGKNNENNINEESLNNNNKKDNDIEDNNKKENDIKIDDENKINNINNINDDNKEKIIDNKDENNKINDQVNDLIDDKKENDKIDEENNIVNKENIKNNKINENENKNEGDPNEKIDEKIENNENIVKENKEDNKEKEENNINNKDVIKEEIIINENEKNSGENKDNDKNEIRINKSNSINNDNILINDNNIDNIIDNNIINFVHNDKHNNNNNDNDKKETKYIPNFSFLIKQMQKDSDDVSKRNEIEFINNILLISSDINESNKISCYTLLSYINYEKKKETYIYYLYNKIFNKTFKDLELQKNIEPFYFIRNLYRTAYALEKEKNYFYAYECIKKIYDLKKSTHLDEDSTKLLNKLINRIKKGISDYLNKSVKLFKNLDKENNTNINKFDKIEKLIKDISDNSYQINDNDDDDNNNNNENNDEYLYLINKNWFSKLINFMEDFKSIKDNNQNKNKYKEYFKIVFNSINILNYYLNEDNEKNKYYAFPGPVDNFSIIDWKDSLDDPLNVDENIFLKSDFKDYYLLKKSDFELLKDIFGVTNIIKRKKDNLEYIQIKSIIFDKRFKDKKNNKLLKKRTLQIKKTSTVSEFKNKIIRCVESLFNKENNNNENNEENNVINNLDNKKYNIYFYILDKENKNILIEMCISYVNNIPSFDCLHLKNIQISDDENISKLFSLSNQKKNILIIEIQAENDPLFIKEIANDKYICTQCKKEINSEEDIYKCKICHMSLFCSDKCAKEGKDHALLDKILKEKFFVEEFNLNKLFSEEINSLFIEDNKSLKGKVGLKNNGNTCYMNSSLQCLSNTNDLTKYFLKKLYENDINFANKLGTHGSISSIYYDFIRKMWYGHETVINPIEFLKKFKNNFEENKQHDAQEFLNVLLDKLHEDLNHIKYQYNKDFPEEYKKIKEENSIIKDLFDGLFKSEITCEECKESSINYESFRFLSLPIIRSKIQYSFKIFYETKLINFNLEYNPNYTLKDIRALAIEFLKTKEQQVIDLETVILKENKMLENSDEEKVKSIYNGKREIVFYHKKSTNKDGYKYFIYPIEEYKNEKNEKIGKGKFYSLSYPIFFEVDKKNKTFEEFQAEIIERLKQTNFIDNKKNFNEKDKVLNFRINMNKNQKCYFCKKEEPHFCLIDVQKNTEIRRVFEKTGFSREKEKLGCLFITSEYFNKKNPVYLNADLGKEDENPYSFSKYVGLKHLIHLFTNNDNLEGDNKWNCPKSRTHLKSKRKLQIYKAPNYLIIQLKRFKTEGYSNSFNGEKNNMFVSYPINNLDISNYIVGPDKNNAKYDLYGVIEHTGTLNSGHYKAICKNDDNWILYNDSNFDYYINNPVTENAYILFYKRQNLDIIED